MKVSLRARRATLAVTLFFSSAHALVACSSDDTVDFPSAGAAGEGGPSPPEGGRNPGASGGAGGSAGADGDDMPSGSGGVPAASGGTANAGTPGNSSGGEPPDGSAGTAAGGTDTGDAGRGGAPIASGGTGTSACAEPRPAVGCPEPNVLATVKKPWGIAVNATHVFFTTLERSGKLARVPLAGGESEVLSSGEIYPHELTLAGGYALFGATDSGTGHIVRVPIAGGQRDELVAGVSPGIVRLGSNGDDVFYVTNSNVVRKIPILGGVSADLSGGPGRSEIADMVLFDDQLFVANDGVWDAGYTHKEARTAMIQRVPTSGDPPGTLVPQLDYPQFEIAADVNNVFYSDGTAIHRTSPDGGDPTWSVPITPLKPGESPIQDMISDGNYLYFADARALHRLPVTGGTPETMTQGWQDIRRLALDAEHVYFTDNAGGVVVRVAKETLAGDEPPDTGDPGQGGTGGGANDGGAAGDSGGALGCDAEDAECVEPSPVAIVTSPWGLVTDDTHVYFTTYAVDGQVLRAPIAGGDPEPIAQNQTGAYDLARAGSDLFWCLNDTANGHIARGTIAGDPVSPVATGIAPGVRRVSSDGIFAFYATVYNVVMRVPGRGGSSASLSHGPYNSNIIDMVLHDGELYFTNDGIWNANYTEKLPGTAAVRKVHVSGAARPTALVSGLDFPLYDVAVDAHSVYWSDAEFIHRTSHYGGVSAAIVPLEPVPTLELPVVDLVSDGLNLYFANQHTLYTAPIAGGRPRPLAGGMQSIRALAVDANNVYFTDGDGGAVLKIAK